jgi:hypothetical protein
MQSSAPSEMGLKVTPDWGNNRASFQKPSGKTFIFNMQAMVDQEGPDQQVQRRTLG